MTSVQWSISLALVVIAAHLVIQTIRKEKPDAALMIGAGFTAASLPITMQILLAAWNESAEQLPAGWPVLFAVTIVVAAYVIGAEIYGLLKRPRR